MRKSILSLSAIVAAGLGMAGSVMGDVITEYSSRPSFEAAAGGPLTIEDFTPTFHFPITTGVLNSQTNLPGIGIVPGTIQEGVTYSTPVGTGNFFNIDAGGGYTGGFLDGFNPSDREVTLKFHTSDPNTPRAIRAFGFDIGSLGSTDFDVFISFSSGPMQHFNHAYPGSLTFFGFVSDASDITQVVIGNNGGFFGFDFDNFTFSEVGSGGFSLGVSGQCPGSITVNWSGAQPSSTVALIFANNTGSFVIPFGPCRGTVLGLGSRNIRLVNTFPAGSNGSGSRSGQAGSSACRGYLQMHDIPNCTVSNVAQLP